MAVQTDAGVTGKGDIYFGRIAGAPDALGALIEHELKPLVLGTEAGDEIRHRQQQVRVGRDRSYNFV